MCYNVKKGVAMTDELFEIIITISWLTIPIVFMIGLIKQSNTEQSVHPEDFSSKIEPSDHDKAA
ncbi:hypothetical protein A9Q84_17745 [Halobacteriovorax marinus]|uniref:Uncharacterized protein n=1 Tax=Halobacteriovorax marinus TaxID=97084 RepID=A0A1Y5F3R9_9BACT|nr:hypothetical protein A9Q84_17745 [Halobacteriovorax marinus]